MLQKYSISKDFLYSFGIIVIIVLFSQYTKYNILQFNTKDAVNSMLNLSGVLFGFILTIITILFMFDPSNNPIFKKLQKDGLFNQIFKRFFDGLIVTGIALVFFLILSIYFINVELTFWNITVKSSLIFNSLILFITTTLGLRIYKCLSLLEMM